jgi:hypothetical protein
MREPATLKLDRGDELRVEVDSEDVIADADDTANPTTKVPGT